MSTMGPRPRKVLRDLTTHPGRALALLLACWIGAGVLVAAVSARSMLQRDIVDSFERTLPADLIVVLDQADAPLRAAMLEHQDVQAAELRRTVRGRARAVKQSADWQALVLSVVPPGQAPPVNTFVRRPAPASASTGGLSEGAPAIWIEQSSAALVGGALPSALELRLPGGKSGVLPVRAWVQDGGVAPGWQDKIIYGYVSAQALSALDGPVGYDELRLRLRPGVKAAAIVATLRSFAESAGHQVLRIEAPTRQHPHADHMNTLLLLLAAFSVLAMVGTAALAATLVTHLMAQQRRQIGIMRTIGAPRSQLAVLYAAFVALPAGVGALLAMPLGAWLARRFAGFAGAQLNLVDPAMQVSWPALVSPAVIAWCVPLLSGLLVAWRATAVPVREALLPSGFGAGWRLRPNAAATSPALALVLRGAFVRGKRTALAVAALALGGAAVLTAGNVYRSLIGAVDRSLATRSDSLEVRLTQPVAATRLLWAASILDGVARAEEWGALPVALLRADGLTSSRYGALAPPADSALARFAVRQGRWLGASGDHEIVVPRTLMAREPAFELGAQVTLRYGPRHVRVKVVGIVDEITEPSMYATRGVIDTLTGQPGTVGALRLSWEAASLDAAHDAARQRQLEDALFISGIVGTVMSLPALRVSIVDHFAIILALLSAAAAAALLVGAMSLATSVGAGVLERSREIGVMRAIGAAPQRVIALLLGEAAATVGVAVLLGYVLAWPATALMTAVLGAHGIHAAVPMLWNPLTALLWPGLAGIVLLAAVTAPAASTLRLGVREALAYE